MSDAAKWIELAERCEKATGPDRELDAAVMFDAFAVPVGQMSDGGPRGYLWPSDNPSWSFGLRFPGKGRDWFAKQRRGDKKETLLLERDGALVLMNDIRVPALTGSLDAITALVEEQMPGAHHGYCRTDASTWAFVRLGGVPIESKPAATPVLALCAAFCRAMAAKEALNA